MTETKIDYEKIEKTSKGKVQDVEETEVQAPETTPIVDVQPKKYKKGLMERLVVAIIGPDGLPSIGRRVSSEIVAPALKDILVNSVKSGIDMFVYKDGGAPMHSHPQRRGNSVRDNSVRSAPMAYDKRYGRTTAQTVTREPSDMYRRNGGYVDQYLITDRRVAQEILNGLKDRLADYKQVSVATYYGMMDVEGQWTDNDIGWTDLRSAHISVVRGGYVLDLPRVEEI